MEFARNQSLADETPRTTEKNVASGCFWRHTLVCVGCDGVVREQKLMPHVWADGDEPKASKRADELLGPETLRRRSPGAIFCTLGGITIGAMDDFTPIHLNMPSTLCGQTKLRHGRREPRRLLLSSSPRIRIYTKTHC